MSEGKITENVPHLNDQEAQALRSLREELGRLDGNLNAGVTDMVLSRFLRINGWDVAKTLAAYTDMLKWRKDNKIDSVLDSPPPKLDVIKRLFSYNYHGFDREGRPIYWERTGKVHCQALVNHVPPEVFLQSHIWGLEYLSRQCREQSAKLGRRIDQFTTVLDLDGLSLGHRVAVPYVQVCTALDNKYYPESLGKLYIINAPWIMPALYQLVAVFLDDATKSRIEIVSGDYKAHLLQHIPPESLPAEYGGRCECKGGCVPIYDASELLRDVKSNDGLEFKNVPAGGTFDLTLSCGPEGGTFTWYFHSEGDYDVGFSVQIVSREQPLEQKVFAKQPSRVVTSKGSYTAKGECKLVLVWDNSFSYFTSKDIKYITSVAKVDLEGFEGKAVEKSETREEEKQHGRAGI